MGRKHKGNQSDFPESGKFTLLSDEMQKSPAWQALSNCEKLAYINIKFNHHGDNNKEIICPYKTIVNKMSETTWAKAIKKLVEYGFITIEYESRGLGRLPNKYGLSNEWKRWGTDQFKPQVINYSKDPNKGFAKLWQETPERMKKIRRERAKKKK